MLKERRRMEFGWKKMSTEMLNRISLKRLGPQPNLQRKINEDNPL